MLRCVFVRKLDLSSSRITARLGIGTLKSGGLGLVAGLDLDAPGISRADAVYFMERAHETCPYSCSTRGQYRRHAHSRRHGHRPSGSLSADANPPQPAEKPVPRASGGPVWGRLGPFDRLDVTIFRSIGALLLLGPLVVVLDRFDAAGELTLFVLAGDRCTGGTPVALLTFN